MCKKSPNQLESKYLKKLTNKVPIDALNEYDKR